MNTAPSASDSPSPPIRSDGGSPAGESDEPLLAPRQFAGILGVLAAGQLLGLVVYGLDIGALYGVVQPIRLLFAVPLYAPVYAVFTPQSVTPSLLFGAGYLVIYAAIGWRAASDGGLPSGAKTGVQLFFAVNAIAYAVSPFLYIPNVTLEYYRTGLTIPLIVVYGVLMGGLAVAAGRLPTPRTGGTERTPQSGAASAGSSPAGATTEPAGAEPSSAPEPASATGSTREGAPESEAAGDSTEDLGDPQPTENEPRGDQSPPPEDTEPTAAPSEAETTAPPETAADPERTETPETDASGGEVTGQLADLESPDAETRLAAVERLAELAREGESVDVESLAAVVEDDPDATVREAAVAALGELDTEAARETLRRARVDPDPAVSSRAKELL